MASNSYFRAAEPKTQSKRQNVTAEHTLERVRNNQRRHRARRRDYIGTLEQKLRIAEQTITALRDQVKALQVELAHSHNLRTQIASGCPMPQDQLLQSDDRGRSPTSKLSSQDIDFQVFSLLPDVAESGSASESVHQPTDAQIYGESTVSLSVTSFPEETATTMGNCCSEAPSSKPNYYNTDQHVLVLGRENAPSLLESLVDSFTEVSYEYSAEGESTVLCAEACLLITQQNFKEISQKDIVRWLRQGFRKSNRHDEGCRVRTDLLFSLLTFISDV